jgi:hypothetical protein
VFAAFSIGAQEERTLAWVVPLLLSTVLTDQPHPLRGHDGGHGTKVAKAWLPG